MSSFPALGTRSKLSHSFTHSFCLKPQLRASLGAPGRGAPPSQRATKRGHPSRRAPTPLAAPPNPAPLRAPPTPPRSDPRAPFRRESPFRARDLGVAL